VTEPSAPEEAPRARRPVSIFLTVACAIAGLVDLQAFAFAFARQTREASAGTPWLPGLAAGVAVLQIVCLVLLWRGRRAGAYGYFALALIYGGVFTAVVGLGGLRSLAPAVLVLAAVSWNWERLR
jgi:hypothetical protein